MGKVVNVIAKTPAEEGLSFDTLQECLAFIRSMEPNANDLTVIAVGANASWTINEISIDGNFIRLFLNHDDPAVHPDK